MGLVDTNVLVVANARNGENQTCVNACVDCLAMFTERRDVLHLDSLGHILEEYGNNIQYGTPQGVGDAFFVWATTFQATSALCCEVTITEDSAWGYAEFPKDTTLGRVDQSGPKFDPSDRKFVAVAVASGQYPTIYNATDPDWKEHSRSLAKYVTVSELCP